MALHQYGDGTGHGALTANRIIVTPEGNSSSSSTFASALERLQLTPARMHLELGVPRLRPRVQPVEKSTVAWIFSTRSCRDIAASRRPLQHGRISGNLNGVLNQVLRTPDREAAEQFRGLRGWLERALQLNGQPFPHRRMLWTRFATSLNRSPTTLGDGASCCGFQSRRLMALSNYSSTEFPEAPPAAPPRARQRKSKQESTQ
jgi:hypothetical protein